MFLPALPRTLAAALRDATSAKLDVRIAAVADLARYVASPTDRPEVVAALLRALADASARVRASAASALGDAREPTAVDALIALTDDSDPLARQMAVEALGCIAHPRAEDRVQRALFDARPEMRFQAVIAYPRVAQTEHAAMTALVRASRDDDGGIRYIALRVLEERLGERRGIVPLDDAVSAAARARLDDDATAVRVAAALLLARGGDRGGARVLVAVIDGDLEPGEPDDEAAAVEAAGELNLVDARGGLERRAFGAGRILRERFPLLARISLARMGDQRASSALLRDLDGWSRSNRTLAVSAVCRAGLIEALPRLEAMRGRPERADQAEVESAIAALRTRAASCLRRRAIRRDCTAGLRHALQRNVAPVLPIVRSALAPRKEGALILNAASVRAYRPSADIRGYAATKGAIAPFSKRVAQQLAPRDIRVGVVAPGPVCRRSLGPRNTCAPGCIAAKLAAPQ